MAVEKWRERPRAIVSTFSARPDLFALLAGRSLGEAWSVSKCAFLIKNLCSLFIDYTAYVAAGLS
jgi:hypothetical protein